MKRRKDYSEHPEIGSKCQTYYIEKLSLAEIMKDADDDDRSKSYIVNKIIREYYEDKGRLEKKRKRRYS